MKPIKTLAIMLSTAALLSSSTCGDIMDQQGPIIEKPTVKVENGQFTPELLNLLGRVSGATVSPDGKKILYGVTYQDIEQNKGNRELWVMDIDGQNAIQLTKTPSSENNAVWIEGGQRIAFVYKEGDNTQMWVMNADGSSRKCVSALENGVDGFVLSPDEKHVVLISQVKYGKTAQDHHPDLKKANARIIDDLMYKHWDEWVETIPHPFVADFDGAQVTNVKDVLEGEPFESPMKPWGDVESLAWTPDSKSLIYVCRKKVGKDYAVSTNSDLFRYDLESGKTENLTEGMMGYDTYPIVSKSGRLAWLSMEHDGYEADKNRIFLMDTNGEKKDLTANWDYSVDAIAWSPDEKFIYFICPFQGTQPIFRMDVSTQQVDTVAAGTFDYDGLAFAGNDTVVTLRHNYATPNEVFSVRMGEEPKQLSHVNDDLLAQLDSITIEKRMVRTTDGKDMVTWVVLPPKFDPQKKYPAILFCEGGPQSPVSQFWSYRWNFRIMAANGYVVIAPNRRGLPGFGHEWCEAISGDWTGQCIRDYLSAIDDAADNLSYVDRDRMGAVGASFGGFSVYYLAGHHDKRFKAFISHDGAFNLESMYTDTEENWFSNWEYDDAYWNKDLTVNAKRTYENSPHRFVDKWDTPILCIHGEMDYRINANQGMGAFNAARMRGIPAELLIFPDENHWVLKPQNGILWQRTFFNWLDRWLK